MYLETVKSGGQTGSDFAGIVSAKLAGFKTDGVAPKGYRTLDGSNYELKDVYGLKEHWSPSYPPRTEENVKNSDATIRFASDFSSSGEKCTLRFIRQYGKPHLDIDINNPRPIEEVCDWLITRKIKVLNVVGNSESTSPGIYDFVFAYLLRVFKEFKEKRMAIIKYTKHDIPEEVFICDCSSLNHIIRFNYFEAESKDPATLYADCLLTTYLGFLKRIVVALSFIFKFDIKELPFDSIQLRPQDMERLQNILSKLSTDELTELDRNSVSIYDYYKYYQLEFVYTLTSLSHNDIMPELVVETRFNKNVSFLRRMWRGFLYVINKNRYSNFVECFELNETQAKELKFLCKQFYTTCNSST